MSHRPVAIGLLLCEQLIVEEGTRNATLVNCFTQKTGEIFPWPSPPFTVAAWLTNGEGEVLLEVIVEDAKTLDYLYRQQLRFRFATPLQQGRLTLRLSSLVFPVPGPYRVTLLADGEIIAQRKLAIVPKETPHE